MSADAGLAVLGVDHVYLSVTDFARSESFYDGVMAGLGFRKGDKAIAGEPHAHYFNPVLQLTIRPARSGDPFDAYRAGLHHLCLQLADRGAVDRAHEVLSGLGIAVTEPAEYPQYHDDYYAVFFDDPDGIRLELVAQSKVRRTIRDRWDELEGFLNPLSRLSDEA